MIDQIKSSDTIQALPSTVDLDLLATLLEPEDASYPWNPADEQAESYFYQLEEQFTFGDLQAEDWTNKANSFYNQLDALWLQVSSLPITNNLQHTLHQAFAAFIPSGLLNSIADRASELFKLEQSAGEKLANCIQSLLPNWEIDDLLVLARPYAYSMRGGEGEIENIISSLSEREWSSLSAIEQAKFSLAIANYAFQILEENCTVV
ncbi:MAG TPA: hypothetical protein VK184_12835 [Nostocaceae cyanobacterium]|nr:hypothetical protein [Nostocaceae cyanobacterium]